MCSPLSYLVACCVDQWVDRQPEMFPPFPRDVSVPEHVVMGRLQCLEKLVGLEEGNGRECIEEPEGEDGSEEPEGYHGEVKRKGSKKRLSKMQ